MFQVWISKLSTSGSPGLWFRHTIPQLWPCSSWQLHVQSDLFHNLSLSVSNLPASSSLLPDCVSICGKTTTKNSSKAWSCHEHCTECLTQQVKNFSVYKMSGTTHFIWACLATVSELLASALAPKGKSLTCLMAIFKHRSAFHWRWYFKLSDILISCSLSEASSPSWLLDRPADTAWKCFWEAAWASWSFWLAACSLLSVSPILVCSFCLLAKLVLSWMRNKEVVLSSSARHKFICITLRWHDLSSGPPPIGLWFSYMHTI